MKGLLFGYTLYVFCITFTTSAKNDTIVISDLQKAMDFDTYFSGVFSRLAKEDIREIMEQDANFKSICRDIKLLILKNSICDVNSIIPILKSHGSLRHIINYKKMFHIYFREIKATLTWANSIYYIIDDRGYFVYVEFKDIYNGQHLIFDQALLKNVRIHRNMLKAIM